MNQSKTRLTYREMKDLIATYAALHLFMESLEEQSFKRLIEPSKSMVAPFKVGLTYLATMTDSSDVVFTKLPPLLQKNLKRIGGWLSRGKVDKVAAELVLVDAALARVRQEIKYYELLPKRQRGEFADEASYEEACHEYQAFREELDSLEEYRSFLMSKRDVILYAVDRYHAGFPDTRLGSLHSERPMVPLQKDAAHDYFVAFRSLADAQVCAIKAHPDEPFFCAGDLTEPVFMQDCVNQIKHRYALKDYIPSMTEFWGRLAARSSRPGSAPDKVRKALAEESRQVASPVGIRITGDDDLDTVIAKLLVIVLEYDLIAPGWSQIQSN